MYEVATFTGTTSTANEAIMTAIKATANIGAKQPMCFKSVHIETTAETTNKINNGIAMKMKPSPLVSGNFFIDVDKSICLVGFITIVDTGIVWELTGAY